MLNEVNFIIRNIVTGKQIEDYQTHNVKIFDTLNEASKYMNEHLLRTTIYQMQVVKVIK